MHAPDAARPPQDDGPLYSIGEAARAAGMTPQALRMWEERYGRPQAVRLPSGHRRYTDEQVRWLRRMSEALARGHRPAAIVHLSDDELMELLDASEVSEELGKGPRLMLDWLRSYGADQIRAWLEARWDPENSLAFLEEEIAPLLRAVGRSWADGELDVRHEHFLSELLEDELRRRRGEFQPSAGAPTAVLATLPGELHGIGLQMAALSAAAHGLHVRVLGVNTPVESIVRAATEVRADVVAVSVSSGHGGPDTDRTLVALRKSLPSSILLVAGGLGIRTGRRKPRGVECPDGLRGWDRLLSRIAAG